MKTSELVSIIVPCYNQAQYLEESVQSAIHQTYQNIEIIIVNDGSRDNTQEVAESLRKKNPELIHVLRQENMGLSKARNTGIRKSKGKYILPLDADDKISEHMISRCIQVLNESDVDIVSTGYQFFGEKIHSSKPREFCKSNLLYTNCIVGCSLYKRKVWTKTGGYKKNMDGGYEDWEFWINAYKHGFKFKRFFETLFYYRIKKESMYTDAIKKDLYLKSKIIMNHPELYPKEHVKRSIDIIRDSESLADLYFYCPVDCTLDQKDLIEEINHYLNSEKLEEKQFINIPASNQKIDLYKLDILKDEEHLKQLCTDKKDGLILFYSSLRYKIPMLRNLNFAWDEDKGIIETKGSIFSFVFKHIVENEKLQLMAYQRFYKYQTEVFEPKTKQQASIFKQRIENRENMIDNREKMIQNKEIIIEKKKNLISKQNDTLHKLKKSKRKCSAYTSLISPNKEIQSIQKFYKKFIKYIRNDIIQKRGFNEDNWISIYHYSMLQSSTVP